MKCLARIAGIVVTMTLLLHPIPGNAAAPAPPPSADDPAVVNAGSADQVMTDTVLGVAAAERNEHTALVGLAQEIARLRQENSRLIAQLAAQAKLKTNAGRVGLAAPAAPAPGKAGTPAH